MITMRDYGKWESHGSNIGYKASRDDKEFGNKQQLSPGCKRPRKKKLMVQRHINLNQLMQEDREFAAVSKILQFTFNPNIKHTL